MAWAEGRARNRASATPRCLRREFPAAAARVTGRSRGLRPPFIGFLKRAALVTVRKVGVSTARIWRVPALVMLTGWLGIGACARGVEAGDDAASAGGRPGAAAREHVLSPTSLVELDLGGRGRRVAGSVELVRGRLWVDADALDRTRADLTFDMTTTRLEGDPPTIGGLGGRSLTEQSLDWLQVRRGSGLGLHPERRYAHVSLLLARSSDGNAARSARAVPATHPGAGGSGAHWGPLDGGARPHRRCSAATLNTPSCRRRGDPRHAHRDHLPHQSYASRSGQGTLGWGCPRRVRSTTPSSG